MNIFFESEIIKHKLEKLTEMVDGVEQLMNAFDAIETAFKATDKLISCVTNCSKAMSKFAASEAADKDKMELFKELYNKISSLETSYATSGNKTLDAAVKLATTGVSDALNAITTDPGEWLKKHSLKDIRELMKKIDALGSAIEGSTDSSRKFNIYDSLRTAISAIPVRFVLKDVIMTEDESNTTRIPWSYTVLPSSAHYFGVSSVSKLIAAYIQVISAEIYEDNMPSMLQLVPGLDDPFNKEEAIAYIQATEDEIAKFQAQDSSGKVGFRSWIIPGNTQRSTFAMSRNVVDEKEAFILTCDNENAVYEDGVLSFTGPGMISVTPTTQMGGTLYIEDSEGNLYTYVIDVVEKHECTVGELEVIIPSTEEYDGFAVKCCDTCSEIMEIVILKYEKRCETHKFGEWVTVAEANCMEAGVQTRSCSKCGTVEDEFVFTETHTPGEWTTVKEATTSEEGLKELRCDICTELLDSEIIPVKEEEVEIPEEPGDQDEVGPDAVCRVAGKTRYETGYKVADALKEELGVEKFDAVVVATGKNFADALAGSYLAVRKNAPIILTNGKADNIETLHGYIQENVVSGGIVYILGGEGAVPKEVEEIAGYEVVRLAGKSRYETNLAILEEAGVTGDFIIVATGKSFADSLSASAAKLPILLVKPGAALTEEAKAIVKDMNRIYIIGGTGAVSDQIEEELNAFGTVTRVAGKSRYETSVEVAKTFFETVENAVIASGKNFPDGLCGGPLAAAMNAPLILTADGKTAAAVNYIQEKNVEDGYVLGGEGALSNTSIMDVFTLESSGEIVER